MKVLLVPAPRPVDCFVLSFFVDVVCLFVGFACLCVRVLRRRKINQAEQKE